MRLLSIALALVLCATSANAAEDTLDAVSKQAAQLEADLGKLRDTSPEAGEVLVKLVDLYHDNGRVFGLIRFGEILVTKHPAHPKHRDVMLKVIDGLRAMSRNKESSATIRQFVTRYPKDPECGRLELALAKAQQQLGDRQHAAEAYEAVWRRQPGTVDGQNAVVVAISLYQSLNTNEMFAKAAELGDMVFDASPPSEFAANIGYTTFHSWRRISQWAKSNAIGTKMLAKNLPELPVWKRELLYLMGDSYQNQNQWANAADSYAKARALGDDLNLMSRFVIAQNNAGAQPGELEKTVAEIAQKYPTRPEFWQAKTYLAHAYLRAGDKPKGLAMIAEILPFDATTNSNTSTFVQQNGNEPAQLPQTEQVLQAALAKNTQHAAHIRTVMAGELYRDRMKDLDKTRATYRELLSQSPADDDYSRNAIYGLMYGPANEDDFKASLALILKTRAEHGNRGNLRSYLGHWINEALQNKDHAAHAALAKQQLEEHDKTEVMQKWIATSSPDQNVAAPAREWFLAPERIKSLPIDAVGALCYWQTEYLRQQPDPNRVKACELYLAAVPILSDPGTAFRWLTLCSDIPTPPEIAKQAVVQALKFEPVRNPDIWRRMIGISDGIKDPELVKQSYAWMQASIAKEGIDPGYADSIGDALDRNGMKTEAMTYWQQVIKTDPYYQSNQIYQVALRLAQRLTPPERTTVFQALYALPSDHHGYYACVLAQEQWAAGNLDAAEKILADSQKRQAQRPFHPWNLDEGGLIGLLDHYRGNPMADAKLRPRIYKMVADLDWWRPSGIAKMLLIEITPANKIAPMDRLVGLQSATEIMGDDSTDWDRVMPIAQAAMTRKDYPMAATIVTALLSNAPNVGEDKRKLGRDMVAQSYARMGGVGLAIDESSPIAPLMQAALYLRLGDERLALETYSVNKKLFDEHRSELPVDLIQFVSENLTAAGGDANLEKAEDILRSWLVKNSEAAEVEAATKAAVQLLLAKNYYRGQRYDVARTEYTTIINRFPKTAQAIEADFGIGESFMAQKVYDQAETVFERLALSKDRDVVVRAEFLRGVLAARRGDRDQAREIFRTVLDRVPNIELANQALYNLAEVYGAEERFIDQLELLRTVGRLGRASKRWHTPGTPLSIVVQDSDLGISRGHAKIPVRITTEPGGDQETVYLYSGGAGKGLFRADLDTRLGQVTKLNKVLELTGKDTIKVDYPDEFKSEFKSVPLSDAEIRVAANGKLAMSGSKIVDEAEESFSQRLEREAREQDAADQRVSQKRPPQQIKPGNPVYLQVEDADRDLSDDADKLTIKLTATSGDQVQLVLMETGPHTGIFTGTALTGELPAGALASDTAIEHSPLMAIDQDKNTSWLSEPDGATPKWLSVDMKDLKPVDRVAFLTPDPTKNTPVRGDLQGSYDGRLWFRIASYPPPAPIEPVIGEFGKMKMRVFAGNFLGFTEWKNISELTKNNKPVSESEVEQLSFTAGADSKDAQNPFGVVWHGKLVQPRTGPVRIRVSGTRTAVSIDGALDLPIGPGDRNADVWLEAGTHDVTIFSAIERGWQTASANWAQSSEFDSLHNDFRLHAFRADDFDLDQSIAKPAKLRGAPTVKIGEGSWDFRFEPFDLRHVRFMIHEYRGEAVAINRVAIADDSKKVIHIPTKDDVLSLANNDTLELAAGDVLNATYIDEFTQNASGGSQSLSATLSATYHNASINSIAYDFNRRQDGQIDAIAKQLMRVEPGERVVVQVTDYDRDQSASRDEVKIEVQVNDEKPVELVATETKDFSGVFTKEVDTVAPAAPAKAADGKAAEAKPADTSGKLVVKPGDRITCRYVDEQNTFPGHASPRETVVYVNKPTTAQIRVVETRVTKPANSTETGSPQVNYLPASKGKQASSVAFEAPFTVEVIDRDAAKDSKSSVIVQLTTTSGAKIDVKCVVSGLLDGQPYIDGIPMALEEGHFVGQVIMQLGGKETSDVVPLTANMPRNLVGGGVLAKETEPGQTNETVIVRVLNVSGKDTITATYNDERHPKDGVDSIASTGQLLANGSLACTDGEYLKEVAALHVGEKMYLMVSDADLDVSDERDEAELEITSKLGEKETIKLSETLIHSGIFTGSIVLKPAEKPTPNNTSSIDPTVETFFGDMLNVRYVDRNASTETGKLEINREMPVVAGTDGLVSAFSKVFNDENLAVETQFHVAESYFELFKSHKSLTRKEEQQADLEAGRRVLKEVMEDYPNPKYVPRTAYLLGQFSQELSQWDEAITSYQLIVRQFPDSSLAADAQYKLAQCYEESGDFENALEAYVTLAATYPKSPLIANVMVRISDHFYKKENFVVSANVGEKFLEKFEGHEWAPRIAFRVGQCYYKGKKYEKASVAFDKFVKTFPDEALSADALFWAGESYRMANKQQLAFRRYNRCRWDFPSSDAAKYARGRLAMPEMLEQFESESALEQ